MLSLESFHSILAATRAFSPFDCGGKYLKGCPVKEGLSLFSVVPDGSNGGSGRGRFQLALRWEDLLTIGTLQKGVLGTSGVLVFKPVWLASQGGYRRVASLEPGKVAGS